MKRIAKNKHPTGQRLSTKALLKRCHELEDCVMSQQKVIAERDSVITNNQLGHDLMKRKYEDMQKYVQLNRPEILQLMKSLVKHSATGGPTLDIKLVKSKRKAPKIPDAPVETFIVVDERGIPQRRTTMKIDDPIPAMEDVKADPAEVWNSKTRKFEPKETIDGP